MTSDVYPSGTINTLLNSDLVTPQTRQALLARWQPSTDDYSSFLGADLLAVLRAAVARLLPNAMSIDLAAAIDRRLASDEGDGWRYDALPTDREAYQRGLQGLDESALGIFNGRFAALDGPQQDQVLQALQRGDAPGAVWASLNARRYFEDLLAELTELYYSSPSAQDEIGYAGMADARGWQAIGLDQLESWEPRPIDEGTDGRAAFKALDSVPVDAALSTPEPAFPMKHYALDDSVDAVVIGTGAGGAPLIARLAQAGLRVVALEAGRFWQPGQDFATDEREQGKLFWRDERLSAGADPVSFGSNNSGIGVGGSTLHYTAYVPRPQPDDFQIHRDFGVGVDWPLGYADLEPYFDELEQFLGVSGPANYPWGPPRKPYPLASLPLNGAAQLMQRGCAALGLRTSPAANAALSAPYYQRGVGWRAACTNRGFCQAGCSVGAKASMDVTFIPLAISNGAEIRSECFVTGFARNPAGRLTHVIYSHGGVEFRQACHAVFLCAGAVETPRLLLLNDLANSSGQVGQNFMAHMGVQVWGQFDEDVRPYKGIPGALISEDTHRPPNADFASGYLLQSIGVMPVTYGSQVARGRQLWGLPLHDHMRGYNHTAGINILGDCLPYAENYLELSDERDARGLPKPRIHFTYGENERKMTAHAEALMRQIWGAAGAADIWAFPRGAHTVGTCRMGTDPAQSVINAEGRTYDIPNLYISDNSTFPSALSVNPALTIMALALRTADRFIEHARQQED